MSKTIHLKAQAQALLNTLEMEKIKIFKKQKKLRFHAVLAQSLNGVIGLNGSIPWQGKEPEDLKSFAQITKNAWVFMGRKTYESLPKPLVGRKQLVYTQKKNTHVPENVYWISSLNEMMQILPEQIEVFIIGGRQVYESCFFLLDAISVTLIKTVCAGDVFYNIFNEMVMGDWQKIEGKILSPSAELFYFERYR